MAPRSNSLGKLREIVEAGEDPKQALISGVGDLGDDRVQRCQLLCATFAGDKFHAGTKILRTDTNLVEQRYQGSIFLVMKAGPGAFKDAPGAQFYGEKAEVGDWVLARPSDGLELFINEVPCRLFEDANILMVVKDPEKYW